MSLARKHPGKSEAEIWDGERMRQITGMAFIIAGVVCFWLESADKSRADWRIDALGILLALFALWLGNFKFKKNQSKPNE